jgi:putative transposase
MLLLGPADRQRREVLTGELAILEPGADIIAAACEAFGLSRATFHRRKVAAGRPVAVARCDQNRHARCPQFKGKTVSLLLQQPDFVDPAPAEI